MLCAIGLHRWTGRPATLRPAVIVRRCTSCGHVSLRRGRASGLPTQDPGPLNPGAALATRFQLEQKDGVWHMTRQKAAPPPLPRSLIALLDGPELLGSQRRPEPVRGAD
jgi:hypothetical protein